MQLGGPRGVCGITHKWETHEAATACPPRQAFLGKAGHVTMPGAPSPRAGVLSLSVSLRPCAQPAHLCISLEFSAPA